MAYNSVSGPTYLYGIIVEFEPEFDDLPADQYGIIVKILLDKEKLCSTTNQRFFESDLTKISKEEFETLCLLEF